MKKSAVTLAKRFSECAGQILLKKVAYHVHWHDACSLLF